MVSSVRDRRLILTVTLKIFEKMIEVQFFPLLIAFFLCTLPASFPAFETDGELVIQLVSGIDNSSGRVEVGYSHNPARFSICADDFTINAARVVCRVLGFKGTPRVSKPGFFGRKGQMKWLTGLRCIGTESKLEECKSGSFNAKCRKGEDAGVFCSNSKNVMPQKEEQWSLPDPMVCGVDSTQKQKKKRTYVELDQLSNIPTTLLVRRRPVKQEVKEEFRIAKPDIIESTASFPWIAQIRLSMGEESMYMCGATIISEFFVLTSARCANPSLLRNGLVRVGDLDVSEKEEFEREYEIENMSTTAKDHPNKIVDSDIALVKLKPDANGKGIAFSQYVLPACLPSAHTPYMKSMICTIGGYGRDEFFKATNFLRIGSVPLLSREQCRLAQGSHGYLQPGLFCAGGLVWSSTGCSDDRGSPLICKINGRSTLLGIDSISGCGNPGKISYYADVQNHLKWIAEELKTMTASQGTK